MCIRDSFDAVAEGDFLVFETTHLSQYAILGSNTPFSTSTVQDGEQTGAGDQSSDTTIPQTGDGSNMMLWIGLLAASGAGVYGMTLYSRKKKEQKMCIRDSNRRGGSYGIWKTSF